MRKFILYLKWLCAPKWCVEYLCTGCRNHYCGDCGRGVSDVQVYRTCGRALLEAHDWVCQQEGDPGTAALVKVLPEHTIVSLRAEGERPNIYAVVSYIKFNRA